MKKFFFLSVLLLLCACSGKDGSSPPVAEAELYRGTHVVTYNYYAPLAGKPVAIYYNIPEDGDLRTMHILFAMHGADRDAEYQIETWRNIADQRGVMVFAPLFSKEYFPANRAYQYGGVSLQDNIYTPVDRQEWTVSIIEPMFDYIRRQTGSTRTTYDIWGHSAGAQFTHRLTFHLPQNRIRMAVASNAGAYLMPSLTGYAGGTHNFPYSLRTTDFTEEDIKTWFSRPLVVHLGTADISETDSSLPKSAAAMAQGSTRYARGQYFYEFARQAAEDAGVPFNWSKVEVNNIAHNSRGMVRTAVTGAADLMYPDY